MDSKALVLLYNFTHGDRLRRIRRFLRQAGIQVKIVETPEFWQPLGYLAEIPGFDRDTAFHLGGNFTEEMLVMKDLSSHQTDAFLAFFRENNLPGVALKAVLTPVNQHWNSLQLYEELSREHREMSKR